MTMNRDLIEKVLAKVLSLDECPTKPVKNKDYWDQGTYFHDQDDAYKNYCGTAGCFAGWTIMLDNPEITTGKQFHLHYDGVEERATDLLGITGHQANQLFALRNTKADIKRICKEILCHTH